MDNNKALDNENKVLQDILTKFDGKISGEVRRHKRVFFKTDKDNIESVLLYAKEKLGYIHFTHMSCVDWIEDNKFELVYILWSPVEKINIFFKILIDREKPVAPNIDYIWRQANTYEREIREMYGIEFDGLVAEKEFILEDWNDIPPMRREFDTMKYAVETYFPREGREDAKDVRETIAERSGEEIPEFAKKYSR